MVIYATEVYSIFEVEKDLLTLWIRRVAFIMFMISTHTRIKLIDKIPELWPVTLAAQVHKDAADALTEGAIQRASARASLWRWQKDEIRNEICPCPTSCSEGGCGCKGGCVTNSIMTSSSTSSSTITNGSSSNGSSSSSGVVFKNSIQHQNNIDEVFTRWSIFHNITSFL